MVILPLALYLRYSMLAGTGKCCVLGTFSFATSGRGVVPPPLVGVFIGGYACNVEGLWFPSEALCQRDTHTFTIRADVNLSKFVRAPDMQAEQLLISFLA
ncbi:hypothetical protein DER46DRAFT_662639 [Fusarium sp. MPI-SDFR-AT-0072]|nr:hypothetical protein DER46DRAFT_662639 [Fusarium sp. MPI-SDFR-AT-0072]